MFGVYIHFPYCRKRCPYCDFAVHVRQRLPHEHYSATVRHELSRRAGLYPGRRLRSVYFGGGTPGLWRPDCVAEVLAAVRAAFPPEGAPADVEVTLEANPDDLPRAQLEGLRDAGVNRLSLGVQSFDARQLVTLGRLHGAAEPRRVMAEARALGFARISVDVMFGLPGQTPAALDRDLDAALALEPDHLSAYNLTVEARTPFAALTRTGALVLPDDGACAELYARVDTRLAAAGFQHYEISSWARPGRRAVHNSLYWTGGEWLGLGCSAASCRIGEDGGAERFTTVRSVDAYFGAAAAMHDAARGLDGDPALAALERLDAAAREREAMWLGLRLLDGIDRRAHAARHGVDPLARHAATVTRLEAEGLVEVSATHLRLTRRGVLFADDVGARFV